MLALLLLACNGSGWDVRPGPEDTAAVDDRDTGTPPDPEPDDTASGTDADGDGWTVEDGDCDDDDVWVNPSWDESGPRKDDGKDNDCDGMIDERFVGVTVLDVDTSGETLPRLVSIDRMGELTGSTPLTTPLDARWLDEDHARTGWYVTDGGALTVSALSPSGGLTPMWSTTPDEWPDDDPLLGLAGVAAHPDGSVFVSAVDRLVRLSPDGAGGWTHEVVASWDCLEDDGRHELAAVGLTASRVTGEVALFGESGGVAFWRPGTGFELAVPEDPTAPTHVFWDAHTHGARGHFALGYDVATEGYGIWRWNAAEGRMVLRGAWPDPDYEPTAFAIDDESGDFYVTANGGWYQTVWRMVADGTYTTDLFQTDPVEQHRRYRAIATRWAEGG